MDTGTICVSWEGSVFTILRTRRGILDAEDGDIFREE